MKLFNIHKKINENTSTKELEKELVKAKAKLSKKSTKLDSIKAKMDTLYNAAIKCGEESLAHHKEGKTTLASKKLDEKMGITKKYTAIKSEFIELGREVEFLHMRVEKIDGLLGN